MASGEPGSAQTESGSDSPIFADVAVPLGANQLFTYRVPQSLDSAAQPGVRVLVPFGRRHLIGLMVRRIPAAEFRCKELLQVLDSEPVLSPLLLELASWVSRYYFAPPGEAIRSMLPPGLLLKSASPADSPESFWPVRRQLAVTSLTPDFDPEGLTGAAKKVLEALRNQELPVLRRDLIENRLCTGSMLKSLSRKGALQLEEIDILRSPWSELQIEELARPKLTSDQVRVLEAIRENLETREFSSALIHGVTASGKTEVYMHAIDLALEQGRTALMLVPEIALTPQVSGLFRARFGKHVAILHSALSSGERFDQWRRIWRGEARVVLGTRSAVFAPLKDVGLVIVDEEQDTSYKQQESPRYHGRDTALKRAQLDGAVALLGSATPQLETYYQSVFRAKHHYLPMEGRILDRALPVVHIVDMRHEFQRRGKSAIISSILHEMLQDRLERRDQSMILLNRRGYSKFLMCRSCGHTESCVHCSISLTYHQSIHRLSCHYCGYGRSVPESCRECGKTYLQYVGEGTEKIEQFLREQFPGAEIDRLDRDTIQRKGSLQRILTKFAEGKTDILIGTQMIAKGHDFPGVTLVGVLGADQGLKFADFRAAERTFQLLTQVSGRAGRGEHPGEVVIQTYYPNHYSLKYACTQDYAGFARSELEFRKKFRYPPYSAMAGILLRHRSQEKAFNLAERLVSVLNRHRDVVSDRSNMRVFGPAMAPLEKIKKDYRVQILIKTTSRLEMHEVLARSLSEMVDGKEDLRSVALDMDPVNLL